MGRQRPEITCDFYALAILVETLAFANMGDMGAGEGIEQSQQQIDPAVFRARRKMEALNLNPAWGEVLCAPSEDEALVRVRKFHISSNPEQLLSYVFAAVYATDAQMRASAQQALQPVIRDWGLPGDFIDKYISWTEAADAKFELDYEKEATPERRKQLRDVTREFAFKAIREYLLRE